MKAFTVVVTVAIVAVLAYMAAVSGECGGKGGVMLRGWYGFPHCYDAGTLRRRP